MGKAANDDEAFVNMEGMDGITQFDNKDCPGASTAMAMVNAIEAMQRLQPESGMVVQAVTVMELIAQRIDDAMEKVLDGSGEYPDVLAIVNEELDRACVGYVGVYNIQGELRPGLMHASVEQAAKMSAKAVGDPPFLCFVIRR